MERPLGSKYVLETTLGRGATGQVWKGRATDGTVLAFKVLHDTLSRDPETVRRFLQESAILLQLTHPNLVRVHDLVAEGETLAIVMDLVTGRDLRGVLNEYGALPPGEACRLAADAAAGLAAVHQAGIVHRDIKPENVLLDQREDPPGARLTDFGIARIAEQSGSGRSTMLVGTPQYIAPEVFDGQAPTPASDLYALGITLYEMCCGVTPFAGGSTLQILRKHVDNAPGRPDGIPDPLWQLIAGLLSKNPADRSIPTPAVVNQLTALAHDLAALPSAPALVEPPPSIPLVHDQVTDKVELLREQGSVSAPSPVRQPEAADHGRPHGTRRKGRRVAALTTLTLVVAVGTAGGMWAVLRGSPNTFGARSFVAGATPTSTTHRSPATPTPSPTSAGPSVSVAPGQLPSLVGQSLDQVKRLLPASVNIQTDLVSAPAGTPDGVALSQDPAPGTAMPPSVHLTVASSKAVAYLADMAPTSGQFNTPNDGQPYLLSGSVQLHALGETSNCYGTDQTVEYDLGSHYDNLIGLIGVDDGSAEAKSKATVELFGDQRKLASFTATLGKPAHMDVSVTGVLRLSVRWNLALADCSKNATFVLGNAQLTAALGFLPTPVPASSPSSGAGQ